MTHSLPVTIPKIFAHRGASGTAPENTLAAIRRAHDLGATAIEFDVTVSRDGIAMLQHDYDVERCSNGSGPIILKDLEEIRTLDAGSWFGPEYTGEQIPTLEDTLKLAHQFGLFLNMEIKPCMGWEEPTARAAARSLKQAWSDETPLLVSSMSELALQVFREQMPDVPRGLITHAIPENWQERLLRHECISLHFNHAYATRDNVKALHDAGYKAMCFTVNDPEIAQNLLDIGIDAIITNFPEKLLPLV